MHRRSFITAAAVLVAVPVIAAEAEAGGSTAPDRLTAAAQKGFDKRLTWFRERGGFPSARVVRRLSEPEFKYASTATSRSLLHDDGTGTLRPVPPERLEEEAREMGETIADFIVRSSPQGVALAEQYPLKVLVLASGQIDVIWSGCMVQADGSLIAAPKSMVALEAAA